MFAKHLTYRILLLTLVVLGLWALLARDTGAAGAGQRYRVEVGDTLWSLAEARYAGDPRRGVWEIKQRNGLQGAEIRPGQVLVLP